MRPSEICAATFHATVQATRRVGGAARATLSSMGPRAGIQKPPSVKHALTEAGRSGAKDAAARI